jgi:hypothetical protein
LAKGAKPTFPITFQVYYPIYKFNEDDDMRLVSSGTIQVNELQKRHNGWVIGRINLLTYLTRAGLEAGDNTAKIADRILVQISHHDDLDIAFYMTAPMDKYIMPSMKQSGDEYYMHQNLVFGSYIKDQWRKINATSDAGEKIYDANLKDPSYPPDSPINTK